MGNYAWKTGEREGFSSRKPNYSVKWEWKDPELHGSYRQYTELVHATNAERAINKVYKLLSEDVNMGKPGRRDIIIIHVVPIEGMYNDN
jgi:hypothetical protein